MFCISGRRSPQLFFIAARKEPCTIQKFKHAAGIFCYVLGGFLIVFYLVTLWWGLHPSPSVEYRMYYLDQQLAF